MPTLANIQGGTLVPDLGAFTDAFQQSALSGQQQQLLQAQIAAEQQRQQLAAAKAQAAAAERERQLRLIDTITKGGGTQQEKAMLELSIIDPQAARALSDIEISGNQEDRDEVTFQSKLAFKRFDAIKRAPTFADKQEVLKRFGIQAAQDGDIDLVEEAARLLNLSPDNLNAETEQGLVVGQTVEQILGSQEKSRERAAAAQQKALDRQARAREGELGRAAKTFEDAAGFQRFVTTGERVAPGVAAPPPKAVSPIGKIFDDFKEKKMSKNTFIKAVDKEVAQTQKTVQTWQTADRRVVNSDDGGRTFIDPETGRRESMPPGSVKFGLETGVKEARKVAAIQQAEKMVERLAPALAASETPEAMVAAAGTGPWSSILAAADAVIGGTFNVKTMFPENTDNRNALRIMKQLGKSGLLNSSRAPVYEQKLINDLYPDPDKFWANPDAEMRKIPLLVDTLNRQLLGNSEMIASGSANEDQVSKLSESNIAIVQSLAMLGLTPGERFQQGGEPGAIPTPQTQEEFDALPSGAQFRDPDDGKLRRKN